MAVISHYLRTEYAETELHEILRSPTQVLLGVSANAANALKDIGIDNVFDLGSSWLFAHAMAAAEAGGLNTISGRLGLAPSDWLKPLSTFKSIDLIGELPLENLNGMTELQATAIKAALDVSTIRDFAYWPPRSVAHQLVGDAVGTTVDLEEQHSEKLRPRLGEYPTERVYYDTLTMLQMSDNTALNLLQAPISLLPVVNQPIGFGKPAVGALLTYSQSWYAKGVTLGHMLHSLALAPGEATRIAVIDWSRRMSATAIESVTESEQLDNATQHVRAISEVQNAVANELQQGGSMASGWASSHSEAEAGGSSSGLGGAIFGGGSSSFSSQDAFTESFAESSSWSLGTRSVTANMTQNVNDRTEQHANSVRNRRASAVREVSQSEHEQVSTRIVANYNHMHALTIQYYEVVQVYQVTSQLHSAERCLFVPFEIVDFSAPNAMDVVDRFRGALVRGALTSRIRDLLIDDATMVAIKPSVKVRIPGRVVAADISGVTVLTASRMNSSRKEPTEGGDPTMPVFPKSIPVWDRDQILRVSRILGCTLLRPGSDALYLPDDSELLGISFNRLSISSVRLDRPGTTAADNTLSVPIDSAYVDLPPDVRLSELEAISVAKTGEPTAAGSMVLHCAFRGRPFATPSIPIDLGRGIAMQKVVSLHTDEVNRQRELLAHLQANRAHYSQAVFRSLDSATLVMLLSSFTWNGKALVNQVEPTPLSVAGNFLVFRAPLEPDESSGVVENGNVLDWGTVLKQRGIDFTKADTRLVPVPTDGVFAEAVLGRSNAAEKLDITRFWNWQDSPIPLQPPEISPVGTGSRGTPEDLTPGTVSAPILNIVNPTSLPDPAGLSASLGILANANLFRDMSGLQGTQALSEAALRETLAAASQAGQLASTNLQTEAQRAVAMGQIAGDIAKAAMGIPPTGSTKGISADGAWINHGREMDSRGVSNGPGDIPSSDIGPGETSLNGGGGSYEGGQSGVGVNGGNSRNLGGGSASNFSREGAYSDRGAFGFSPDAAKAVMVGLPDAGGDFPATIDNVVLEWRDLIRFRVPPAVVNGLPKRDTIGEAADSDNIKITIQSIENGRSDKVNLDYYPVYIKKMPLIDGNAVTSGKLLSIIRKNINSFLDTGLSEFGYLTPSQETTWKSDSPLGAVLTIDIEGPDNAAVVCSEVSPLHWRFSTVEINQISRGFSTATGEHPISGTREWGYRGTPERAVFYTRAADRSSYRLEWLSNKMVFPGGHQLWRSFQAKVIGYVNANGGEAEEFLVGERGEPYLSARYEWKTVDARIRWEEAKEGSRQTTL